MLGMVVIVGCASSAYASYDLLDVTLYRDGLAHIRVVLEVDPLTPTFPLELFGPTIDNFVAADEEGRLLVAGITDRVAALSTFGSETIEVNYDLHDLVSKEGRVWTFYFDAPQNYTLTMPSDAVIVGIDTIPQSLTVIEEQVSLEIPRGPAEINYVLNVPVSTEPILTADVQDNSTTYALLAGVPAAAGAGGIILAIRSKRARASGLASMPPPALSAEDIFAKMPDIREEDREIVKHIVDNGGERLESELRKEFLQPRTTMWRAVKRLERIGVVEVIKKDAQNLVRMRPNPEDKE